MTDALRNRPDISESEYPVRGSTSDKLRFLVNYAVLAPSGHNSQPWLFDVGPTSLELHADRSRALPVVDPDDRELVISCGAALFHIRLAAKHFGFDPVVSTVPEPDNPDMLARITLGDSLTATEEDDALFAAISKRHTNRMRFADRDIPHAVKSALTHAAQREGARLHVVESKQQRHALADLIARGDRIQGSDKQFRRELAAWLHANRERSLDGIPGYALGIGDLASYATPLIVRTFDWGRGQAARDRQVVEGAPVITILATEQDSPMAWLQAGQALAHLLLRATAEGVSASFLNQSIEVPELRPPTSALLWVPWHAQLVLRLGYGPEVNPTPRRPVEDVLL